MREFLICIPFPTAYMDKYVEVFGWCWLGSFRQKPERFEVYNDAILI